MSEAREIVSRWVEEAAALGDVDSYSAKRAAKRYSCQWTVEMKVGHAEHRVMVRDVSDTGIGIISPVEIGAGRSVSLRRQHDEPWLEARVMHSTLTVGRYKLGVIIQFEDSGTRPMRGDETPQLAESLIVLSRLKLSRGDAAAAELLVRECLTIRQNALPPGHWITAMAQSVLGECLMAVGRYAGAEPLLLESYPNIKKGLGPEDERALTALSRIVQLYEAWGKPEQADEYRAMSE